MTIGIPLAVRESASRDEPMGLLYASIADGCLLACLRVYGQHTTAKVEYEFGLRQHTQFLAQMNANSVPINTTASLRCAQIQAAIDKAQGREPIVQQDDEGRVWLNYKKAGHWLGSGLVYPAASPAVLDESIGQARCRSRHGQTASECGGAKVIFVHTHDITAGDAFDAGYFAEVDQNNDSGYAWQPKDLPDVTNVSAELTIPDVNSGSPCAALALRMTVLAEMLSTIGAVAVTEHAWRIVLGAYWSWLPRAVGMGEITTPSDAAQLYAAIVGYEGAEVVIDTKENCVLVRHDCKRWDDAGVPRQIVTSIIRAWSAILPNFGWRLRAVVVADTSAELQTVQFDLLGPEG